MIKSPDCRVVIYNYTKREGSNLHSGLDPFKVKIIEITEDVLNVSTSKSKANASGNFNITLAPSNNFISSISSGSWVVIFMDEKKIENSSLTKMDDSVKFIGRIDSVRATRSVDQSTGTFITSYTLMGRDWCSVLESMIYIDTISANLPAFASGQGFNGGVGQVTRFAANTKITELYSKKIPSSTDIAEAIFDIWGKQNSALNIAGAVDKDIAERFLPTSPLHIPIELSKAMGLKAPTDKISDVIERSYGVLVDEGTYDNKHIEAVGAVDFRYILGSNSLWQMLNSTVSVSGINEIFGDLDFLSGTPKMMVYKRVRPFSISKKNQNNEIAKGIVSSFFLLPKTIIDLEDIVQLDIGTNWADIVNFIEVMPDQSMFPFAKNATVALKAQNAIYSTASYAISGFKPMFFNFTFFPPKSTKVPDPYGHKGWLPVLKEWYFDTHKMLNGAISISGISGHIAVGSNIIFPAKAISEANFIDVTNISTLTDNKESYILAHVESVSNVFTVRNNGERSFMTTVSFVRGLITDKDGKRNLNGEDSYGVDSNLSSSDPQNKNTIKRI